MFWPAVSAPLFPPHADASSARTRTRIGRLRGFMAETAATLAAASCLPPDRLGRAKRTEMQDNPFRVTEPSSRSRGRFCAGGRLRRRLHEPPPAATRFARRTGVHYPLVYATDAILYGPFSAARPILPVTIFVRSDGRVAFRQFGPLTERQVRRLLRDKLGIG